MSAKSFRTKNNLNQAWAWIKSNPDKILKDAYGMRQSYQHFTVVEKQFIDRIFSELRSNTYEPTPACKVYLPKPSGGLRPYTLLTVKDQVVYQSLINIIAQQLLPKVEKHYYKKTYGNIYAGESSLWFYRKWKEGYRKFNESARKAFLSGKVFMASFDLVACYDSIDHKVLEHYLKEIKTPTESIELLLKCLSKWTSTNHDERIYQGHGIPQGPMSSGLLSEVVLMAFDLERRANGVSYMRYVDDIHFFAENENDLRFELVRMDRVCKKIGLFPQSSKINIRCVKNIDDELKTVSGIFEDLTEVQTDDYLKVIKQITPLYRIKDISKFKYCVAVIEPTSRLIERLWKIYTHHPEIYSQLSAVIIKYGKLTSLSRNMIEKILSKDNPYVNIQATFIEVLCKIQLKKHEVISFSNIVKNHFGTSYYFRNSDARITAIVFEFLYKYKRLSEKQISYICDSPFWYTRREIARFFKQNESILIKKCLEDDILDVQLMASNNIVLNDIQIPVKKLPPLVNVYLKNNGLITKGSTEPCELNRILSEMLIRKININWKNLLDKHYKQSLQILVMCHSSKSTNIGAWICELDSFNNNLIRAIFDKDNTLGIIPSNYGALLNDPKNIFNVKYKALSKQCKFIHDRRIKTPTAHAYDSKSKTPTKPFKHKELSLYLKSQSELIDEISKIII